MNNYTDLLIRLEKAQREYPETHVLLGQTRTAVEALKTKIEVLKGELKTANTFAVSRRKFIADLYAKVEELTALCQARSQQLINANRRIEELTADRDDVDSKVVISGTY